MSRSEPQRIGPYILVTKLARGGFGNIWQARHEDTGAEVAVKVLHPELVVSEAIVMRFEREARTIATLRHPHVVALEEFGKLPDRRPYIIMELLHGPNLEGYIRDNGSLRPRRAAQVLEQLCSALSAAHKRGIIHRDLKASNVVMTTNDDALRVVLLDFGIVKLLEGNGPELTASRVTVGSPVCMAPEQIQGRPVDPRTDVYALGSLAFLMLTGELPFPGRSMDTMHQHLVAPRPRPSDRSDISPVYDEVIVKAMAKEQTDRHDDVDSFLTAFLHAVDLDEASSAAIVIPGAETPYQYEATVECIGLYLDISVDPVELEDADDELLDDMDAVYPRAARFLERRGFLLAYESGDSALFVLPMPAAERERLHTRRQILKNAEQLLEELDIRDGRDDRIRICLHLHVDQASMTRGLVTEGPLLDITAWVQPCDRAGVYATPTMRAELDE